MPARVLIGRRNDGTYGLDISKPGIDVVTGITGLNDYLFSDKFAHNSLVHVRGETTQSGVDVFFPDLGFVPLITFMMMNPTTTAYDALPYGDFSGAAGRQSYLCAEVYQNKFKITRRVAGTIVRYAVLRIPGGT